MADRLFGSLVLGDPDPGCSHYRCADCGTDMTFSAIFGDGDGVVGVFDCQAAGCEGFASLRSMAKG